MATQTRVSGQGKDYFGSWRLQKVHLPEVDTCSDGSARTVDEALDLEALDYMAATATQYVDRDNDDLDDKIGCELSHVSGLPLVCSNCGVSFFSLQISDDQLDCYCSGECKWSVIMYREMDERMFAMRRPVRHGSMLDSTQYLKTYYNISDDSKFVLSNV
ncbi:hypothetical protein Plhal304r1_c009g0037151 [Plasmopara halstedii]